MEADIYKDDLGKVMSVEEIPADMLDKANEYHTALVEAVAETSDELFEKYCSGEELTVDEIKDGLLKATLANKLVPVLCGTSYKNKGVQSFLMQLLIIYPAIGYSRY